MTVYIVTVGTVSREFSVEADAAAYALAHSASVTSEERPAPSEPIADVTPRQIRQALILSGVNMMDIDTALDSLPEPTRSLAKTEWEYSIAFQRSRPLVQQVGLMLGWTSEQLDDLWRLAASL